MNRFATLEAAQEYIMMDLLGYDEGAWDEDDVEAANGAWYEPRLVPGAGLWEIVASDTGKALPDESRADRDPWG